ncbi:MAG: membrane protein insertase YidC [Pseudomonadota bacterium]
MDRNLLLAVVLSMGVLLIWDLLVVKPQREALKAEREAAAAAEAARVEEMGGQLGVTPEGEVVVAPNASNVASDGAPESDDAAGIGAVAGSGAVGEAGLTIEDALAAAPARVTIDTPTLIGSINLAGGRIDDLSLKLYREEIDDDSPIIRLLRPRNVEHGHYIQQGWAAKGSNGQNAEWTAPAGATLTPTSPVTLTRREGGLVFEKTFSIDDLYMFTVTQKVRNESDEAQSLVPYGLVIQRGVPNDLKNFLILHEGPIAIVGDSLLEHKYQKVVKKGPYVQSGDKGWVGITNKYWLAAAVPPQGATFKADLMNVGTPEAPIFRASYQLEARRLEPGGETTLTSYLFGGPKDADILNDYENGVAGEGEAIHRFDRAVDWGKYFFWLTRPIFVALDFFGDLTGNFGVAILLLTLVIKALLFPLANKAYESMSKMKKLQPELEKLRKRYDDDKMKLQQEMMALYKKEKLNPLAGCVPILIQMPIFYALYKTLFVTIELRHEPFIAWIRDLSAPDPTTVFNLFGLLPYDPTAIPVFGTFLGIGVLPLLMGFSMWFQTKLNPPPADPMQAQIFAMMPILFTFLFASFAAGLVLYWFWNTALSIAQQYLIMRKNGVDIDWGERLPFMKAKGPDPKPPAGE